MPTTPRASCFWSAEVSSELLKAQQNLEGGLRLPILFGGDGDAVEYFLA